MHAFAIFGVEVRDSRLIASEPVVGAVEQVEMRAAARRMFAS
jgi:hypothetical protein